MPFQAKRLRVQLPCKETTAYEPDAPGAAEREFAPFDTLRFCGGVTWWAPANCAPLTPFGHHGRPPWAGDPEVLSIDATDLPVLRAQLEAQRERIQSQLKEIEVAEEALDAREQNDP
jgi:hypothetical protein